MTTFLDTVLMNIVVAHQSTANHCQPVRFHPNPNHAPWLRRRRGRKYIPCSLSSSRFTNIIPSCAVITIYVCVNLASRFKNSRGYVAAGAFIPSIIGAILVNTLPSHDRVGLLISYWISCGCEFGFPPAQILIITFHNYSVRIAFIRDPIRVDSVHNIRAHKAYFHFQTPALAAV